MPKEQTTTYTPKGVSATGEPVNSEFTHVKGGAEVKDPAANPPKRPSNSGGAQRWAP